MEIYFDGTQEWVKIFDQTSNMPVTTITCFKVKR
jgi:hypothetical protein